MAFVKFFENNTLTNALTGEYEYLSSGAMGCAYSGNFENEKNCVIKFNRIPQKSKKEREESFQDSVREAIIGNFVHVENLPENVAQHWSQTLGFGIVKGSIPLLEGKNGEDAERCNKDLKKPDGVHVVLAFKSAGEMNLGEWMKFKGSLGEEDIRCIMFQLLWASQWAFQRFGLIHADIKPSNIVVRNHEPKTMRYVVGGHEFVLQNATISVSIIDLGGAWLSNDPDIEICGTSFGKDPGIRTAFFSPIEEEGNLPDRNSLDLWSLGMTMYCMTMQGENLYDYTSSGEMPPDAKKTDRNSQGLEYARMQIRIGREKNIPYEYLEKVQKDVISRQYVSQLLKKLSPEGVLLLYDLLEWNNSIRAARNKLGTFHPFFVPFYAGRKEKGKYLPIAESTLFAKTVIGSYNVCAPGENQVKGKVFDVY